MEMPNAESYFATARERYEIRLRKESGQEPPWTVDHIYREWRFCNVHREHDKTTIWFRENVRSKLKDPVAVTAATIIFRWFNKIETGEIIKDLLLEGMNFDIAEARNRLKDVTPLVTGAYMIKTVTGMNKLEGALWSIEDALPHLPELVKGLGDSIEEAVAALSTLSYLGAFMSYEVASDLRWTPVLKNAKDIMFWANPGPGCTRGIRRVTQLHFNRNVREDVVEMNKYMRELLAMSQDKKYWPQDWQKWEMREVEHWACEFHKYNNAMEGDRLKRRFNP